LLRDKRITLRGLEVEDATEILRHFNDLEVRRFLATAHYIAKEEEEQWIRSTWEARRKGESYIFGIELNEPKQLIGTCGFHTVSAIHRATELGIAVWNKQYWGKGLGTEALILVLNYGFNILNLHSVYLTVIEDNLRAQRAYLKVGFQSAGRHRQAVYQDGTYKDLLLMDILADEYRRRYPLPSSLAAKMTVLP
jgi:RimJ/RimL family protein N-acetyltransferase